MHPTHKILHYATSRVLALWGVGTGRYRTGEHRKQLPPHTSCQLVVKYIESAIPNLMPYTVLQSQDPNRFSPDCATRELLQIPPPCPRPKIPPMLYKLNGWHLFTRLATGRKEHGHYRHFFVENLNDTTVTNGS